MRNHKPHDNIQKQLFNQIPAKEWRFTCPGKVSLQMEGQKVHSIDKKTGRVFIGGVGETPASPC